MGFNTEFDELLFLAQIKKRPGMYLGRKSLTGLRDYLSGMHHGFAACGRSDALKWSVSFADYYNNQLFQNDQNGYACWWNHLLYISGNMDDAAFDAYFMKFEAYILEKHDLKLPEVG